ncbi:MAG: hypothetical protein KC503_12055 [Myxococcales bacterium]|nr:hypothetical protein [Myxococcales bacterium]
MRIPSRVIAIPLALLCCAACSPGELHGPSGQGDATASRADSGAPLDTAGDSNAADAAGDSKAGDAARDNSTPPSADAAVDSNTPPTADSSADTTTPPAADSSVDTTTPPAADSSVDSGSTTRFALDFPSNVSGADKTAPFVALQFDDPHTHGLPFAGPNNAGVTYMWRVKQRAQTGYYVTLWWAQGDGGFTPSAQYVGGHPYPKVANNTGTTHRWEIAAPSGGDYFDTRAGFQTSKDVVYDVWRTQALRVVRNSNGSKTYTFYSDLPSLAPIDVLEWTSGTGGDIANTPPPKPKITIGDSPWYQGYQHERLSGLFGELIIEAAARSEAEIVAQAQNLQQLTAAFAQAIWYFKPGWRSTADLTCEAGTGRTLYWADPANTAGLGALK